MTWTRSRICYRGGARGIFLPVTESEAELSKGVRAVIYSLLMVYCFLGVSIAADIFMSSIEVITSRRRQVEQRPGKFLTHKVWNATVANLSLMALGSSAPEIFLSVIDLIRNEFHAGALGPSTIVGSAAFNLFIIIAVCMLAIPNGSGRAVEQVSVFVVTAVFSLLAYLWLVFIVMYWTPDIVTIAEATITFAFLPLLIYLSWRVDLWGMAGLLPSCLRAIAEQEPAPSSQDGWQGGRQMNGYGVRRSMHSTVGDDRVRNDAMHDFVKMISASRGVGLSSVRTQSSVSSRSTTFTSASGQRVPMTNALQQPCVQFLASFQSMSSNMTAKSVWICRHGDLSSDIRAELSVYSIPAPLTVPQLVRTAPLVLQEWSPLLPADHCAEVDPAEALKARRKVLVKSGSVEVTFKSGEERKEISVEKPEACGDCEDFFLQLKDAQAVPSAFPLAVGPIDCTAVKVAPGGSRGKIKFACERIVVPGRAEPRAIEVVVLRIAGSAGLATCHYRTEPLSALPDCHYVPQEGTIQFVDGATEARLGVEVLPMPRNRFPKEFIVILDDPSGDPPADFDPCDDGGEASAVLTVRIETDPCPSFWRFLDWLVNMDSIHLGNSDWYDTVTGVLFVGGSLEEQKEAGGLDWIFHLIALPWKLFFVFVPSIHYLGGWVCFVMSLVYIALLTGVIADLADLFGCVLDIPDMVTAITLVALGTSMPDLFASKGAAQEDPTADASIVNVTGSNSVNVFLGLGLPWTIGSIYWELQPRTQEWEDRYSSVSSRIQGTAFVVESRDLGFNVLAFSCCCVIGLIILGLKRRVTGFELGGPVGVKYSIAVLFACLWFAYIGLAAWRVLRSAASSAEEQTVLLLFSGVLLFFTLIALGFLMVHHLRNVAAPPKEVEPTHDHPEEEAETVDVSLDVGKADDGLGDEGSLDIKPPLVSTEAPSGSRGRCFAKS
uniref:Sodium/calcium exchanger membrane region domain-containing protein n=1 Tax=Alexandrium catenella TaxID=2925 RepID=A0A7S1WVY8_ALECA|mmetsp:Transcript_94362/g.250629  ORF Transcript_94362/g.250629 Transcript_94362/m.250629 type:complete len:945 (+) Transcript_94362:134-2968(+)